MDFFYEIPIIYPSLVLNYLSNWIELHLFIVSAFYMLIEKNLNIGHINAQSLACISHFDEIYKILNDNKNLHVLAISET